MDRIKLRIKPMGYGKNRLWRVFEGNDTQAYTEIRESKNRGHQHAYRVSGILGTFPTLQACMEAVEKKILREKGT